MERLGFYRRTPPPEASPRRARVARAHVPQAPRALPTPCAPADASPWPRETLSAKILRKTICDFPQPGDDQQRRGTRERRSPAESEGSGPGPPASSTHQPRPGTPGRASPARGEPPCWWRVPRHEERGQIFGDHKHFEPEKQQPRDRGGARTPPPEGRGRRLSRAGTQVLPAKMTALAAPEAPKPQEKKIEAVPTVVILSVLGKCRMRFETVTFWGLSTAGSLWSCAVLGKWRESDCVVPGLAG